MTANPKSKKGQVLYIYDALCGWCYGFSGVIKKLQKSYEQELSFDILSGGMVMDEREGIIKPEMAEYILASIPRVEEYTGMKFGTPHIQQLKAGSLYQSSLKPSVALCVFKKFLQAHAFDFAADMQYAYFYEGANLSQEDTYLPLIAKYQLDASAFLKELDSDENKYKAYLEFGYVQDLGVTGFPALIGIKNEEYFWISKGYQSYENMERLFQQFLQA